MRIRGQLDTLILNALTEDLAAGDLTTELLIPGSALCRGEFMVKSPGVVAGLHVVEKVFEQIDRGVSFKALARDGDAVTPGTMVARIEGPARTILTGERTALNFLQHLSGIATITRSIVKKLEGSTITLLDTRKTIPGLRLLEKYAVSVGGGKNHRMGLYDGILIKNNHLRFISITEAVGKAKKEAPPHIKVEVEVESPAQLQEALDAGADIIMLDNMEPAMMEKALALIGGKAKVEVSGNITEETLPALLKLPVDYISMGRLTHSAKALDISLKITPLEQPSQE